MSLILNVEIDFKICCDISCWGDFDVLAPPILQAAAGSPHSVSNGSIWSVAS